MAYIQEQVEKALNEKNLNFTASMAENYALIDGEYQPTGMYTVIRNDREGAERVISGHAFSSRFVPVQNTDAFSVIGDMSQLADIEFAKVGSWGNGAGVYAQISLGNSMDIGATHDKVGRYLSLVNSHDGSRALSVLVTPYRFFCQNQIAKAMHEATISGNIVSIRHDIKAETRLNELAATISNANKIFAKTEDQYRRLADKTVTMEEVREAMARMFPFNPDAEGRTLNNWERKVTNAVNRFNDADNGQLDRMTGWNLYNAIQGTFQHDSRRTAMYEHSLLFGTIASKSAEAFQVVNEVLFDGTKTEHTGFDHFFNTLAA